MSGRGAIVAAAGAVLVTFLAVALMVAAGRSPIASFGLDTIVVGAVYSGIGGVLRWRVPGNKVGLLFLVAGWLWAVTALLDAWARFALGTAGGAVPTVAGAAWIGAWLWIPGNVLLFTGLPLIFPDGHLPSTRWRPVALGVGALTIAAVATAAVAGWLLIGDPARLLDSFDPSAAPGLLGAIAGLGQIGYFLITPIVGLLALVGRYRRSRGTERLQMRWFTAAVAFMVVSMFGDLVTSALVPSAQGLVSAASIIVLPIALANAILRYRLYEIDRIVSRTLGWAIVSGALVGAFAILVVGLQALLDPLTASNTVAVAASTLVVAALFTPLRTRVQRAVDRRFDRARYDAERTAAAFAERLRDQTDLAAIHADVLAAVDASLRPSRSGLWVRDG